MYCVKHIQNWANLKVDRHKNVISLNSDNKKQMTVDSVT